MAFDRPSVFITTRCQPCSVIVAWSACRTRPLDVDAGIPPHGPPAPPLRLRAAGQDALVLRLGDAVGVLRADVDRLAARAVAGLGPMRLAAVAPDAAARWAAPASRPRRSRGRAGRTTRPGGRRRRSCGGCGPRPGGACRPGRSRPRRASAPPWPGRRCRPGRGRVAGDDAHAHGQRASDGARRAGGVDVAAAFRPEIILLNIGMPRLNGYDTARRGPGEVLGQEHGAGGAYRLGSGGGEAKIARCWVRLPHGQARRSCRTGETAGEPESGDGLREATWTPSNWLKSRSGLTPDRDTKKKMARHPSAKEVVTSYPALDGPCSLTSAGSTASVGRRLPLPRRRASPLSRPCNRWRTTPLSVGTVI